MSSSPLQQTVRVDSELGRQILGYWFGPDEAIPSVPLGPPTGAVLPVLGASLDGSEVLCLDLVPVEDAWLVQSELGRRTYLDPLNEDEWRFVPVPEAAGDWPVVFAVTSVEFIAHEEIEARYGPEAASRARPAAPAVQLRLTPEAEMAFPPGDDDLSVEERAALLASLERAADDAVAGRVVDAFEHLREYRARRANRNH